MYSVHTKYTTVPSIRVEIEPGSKARSDWTGGYVRLHTVHTVCGLAGMDIEAGLMLMAGHPYLIVIAVCIHVCMYNDEDDSDDDD